MSMARKHTDAELPDGWQVVRLDEIADVIGGSTPSRDRNEFWGGSIPWAVPSEITSLTGRYLTTTNECVTEAGLASAGLKTLPIGSILLTTRATIGAAAISTNPVATNQGFQNLVAKKGADSLWLYYCISSMKRELERRAAGSTFAEISRDSVRSLPILFPTLPEQRAIANVLDSIDQAIERTEEVISATEILRGSLLHELLTRGVPGWHTEWKDVAGIGTIPADWEVVRLGEVASIAFSSVDKKTVEGEVPVRLCNYTDVFYHRRITLDMEFMEATADTKEVQKWNLHRGDVLFTKDSETAEEIGIPAYVTADMPGVLCGYHLGLARPLVDRLEGAYLAEAFGSPMLAAQLSRSANGVTRFGLTLGATNQLQLPLPSVGEQRSISNALRGVDDQVRQQRAERGALQSLKESTADALLTGKARALG